MATMVFSGCPQDETDIDDNANNNQSENCANEIDDDGDTDVDCDDADCANDPACQPTKALGEICDVANPDECPNSLCVADLVRGVTVTAADGTRNEWDATTAICTKTCVNADDCNCDDGNCAPGDQPKFYPSNGQESAYETWGCVNVDGQNLCVVNSVDEDLYGTDSCTGCGGYFCTFACTGCLECQ
jgi:hypothetical protein